MTPTLPLPDSVAHRLAKARAQDAAADFEYPDDRVATDAAWEGARTVLASVYASDPDSPDLVGVSSDHEGGVDLQWRRGMRGILFSVGEDGVETGWYGAEYVDHVAYDEVKGMGTTGDDYGWILGWVAKEAGE